MNKMVTWWMKNERRMFCWINQKWHHEVLDWIMSRITHLGGAIFTISFSISLVLFGPGSWSKIGWHCLIALAASHLPVYIIKKVFPRRRPYLVFPDAFTCKNPLKDHSFPSGHTTAIFSIITVLVLTFPISGICLLPLAFIVGISRIYLGLHYPSDVLTGSLIGMSSALIAVLLL